MSRYCHCQRQGTCNPTIYRPAEVIAGQWNICSDCVATLLMSVTLEIKESHPLRVAILDDEPAELRRVEQTLPQIPANGEQAWDLTSFQLGEDPRRLLKLRRAP